MTSSEVVQIKEADQKARNERQKSSPMTQNASSSK